MIEDAWSRRVLAAFSASAAQYDAAAGLQRAVAWRLAGLCHRQAIPRGVWMDLGSGTGRLADNLERLHPGQSVLRVDGSAAMLSRHGPTAKTRLLDLNRALPKSTPAATLLCSSFVLHWLEAPRDPAAVVPTAGLWRLARHRRAGGGQLRHGCGRRSQWRPCTASPSRPAGAVAQHPPDGDPASTAASLQPIRPSPARPAASDDHHGRRHEPQLAGAGLWRQLARAWPTPCIPASPGMCSP